MSRAARPSVLRFAPVLAGLAALFVFGAGAYLQFQANERAAARVAAYVSGPPAGVPLDRFDAARHTKDYGEALIVAQLDLGAATRLDPAVPGGPSAFAVPMYGVRDDRSAMPRGVALFTGAGYVPGRITVDGLAAMAEADGVIGPQIMLNGIADGPGDWALRLQEAGFRTQTSLVLYPFVEGRRAALVSEGAAPIFGQFAWAGGICGLVALALLALGAARRASGASAALGLDRAPASAAEEESARLDAALRSPIKARRARRGPLRLVALTTVLGGAGYLYRDRIDLTRLEEFARTRDVSLLREVIRPASEAGGQGLALPDAAELMALARQLPAKLSELPALLSDLPGASEFVAKARLWAEAQVLAAQTGDLQAIAYLGVAGLGALAFLSLLMRLLRGLRPARSPRVQTG